MALRSTPGPCPRRARVTRTPAGSYYVQRMERMWYSRKYHMSPMPHALFFEGGLAIHGTSAIRQLGRPASHGCVRLSPKRRFSEVAHEACCDPEDARALQQRLDDEAKPVIAQSQTPVLQHPRGAALHRPAPLAQSRSGWLASRVDLGRDPEEAAQIAMRLRVVPLVR